MSNKYILRLEKSGSLLAGAAIGHVAQNLLTKGALGNKHVGKYIARGFNEGVAGVVDKSWKGKAISAFNSAVIPDIEAMHTGLHAIGQKLGADLAKLSPRQKAVALHVVQKGGAAAHHLADPEVQSFYAKAQGLAKNHLGFHAPDLKDLSQDRERVMDLWKSKKHPLLSNVAQHIGKEDVSHARFKPGAPSAKIGLAASAAVGVVDPAVGMIDGMKAAMGSKAFAANKYGKKISNWMENTFVKKPAIHAFKQPDEILSRGPINNLARDVLVNPVENSLARTSASISKATEHSREELTRSSADLPPLKARVGALSNTASGIYGTARNLKRIHEISKAGRSAAAVSSAADHL